MESGNLDVQIKSYGKYVESCCIIVDIFSYDNSVHRAMIFKSNISSIKVKNYILVKRIATIFYNFHLNIFI